MALSNATIESKFFFQFVFCAVSLAIVWGTTLERIKFGVYVIYAIVFCAIIYPIGAHWVFGGGFLQDGDWLGTGIVGMQDFAGSTAVHLIGATGAFAALLLLGPRKGKYGPDGKPRAIPGHNMPLFGLGVLILWLGWFGFNPGSTLERARRPLRRDPDHHQPGGRGRRPRRGRDGALKTGTIDIGMAGNGAIAALVAITAPSGYVELWAAPIIGAGRRRDRRRSASTASTSTSTTRSARCPRTAWPVSGARSRAASSPRRAWPSTTPSATRGRPRVLGQVHAADRAGGRLLDRLLVRLHPELRDVLGHQEDVRPPRHRRGRGRRAGHLRARHVRLSGAVHPGAGARRRGARRPVPRPATAVAATKKEVPA